MPLNLEERFARTKLAFFPSPVHRLERLSRELRVEIWAKRDDVSSGLAFGGNKVRKLEWLAADALAQGCDTLVSIGNIQSNHTRQVAAVAAVLDLKCRLVQEEWTKWDDSAYGKVGNTLLSRIMGAEIILEGEGYSTAVKATWERALERVRQEGGKPYAIPAGVSDHPWAGWPTPTSLTNWPGKRRNWMFSSTRSSPQPVPARRKREWSWASVPRPGRAG